MILQELLKNADIEAVIASPAMDRDDLSETDKRKIYTYFINMLCSLTPKQNERKAVLLGHWCTPLLKDEEPVLDVSMYETQDLAANQNKFRQILDLPDADKIPDDELEEYLEKLPKTHRQDTHLSSRNGKKSSAGTYRRKTCRIAERHTSLPASWMRCRSMA